MGFPGGGAVLDLDVEWNRGSEAAGPGIVMQR